MIKLQEINKLNLNQKILIAKALKRHPGKILKYCGSKTNWEDCFTIIKGELFFWYNLESGATHTESMIITNSINDLKNIKKNKEKALLYLK